MTVIDTRAKPMHHRDREPNYDKFPTIPGGSPDECVVGWDAIAGTLKGTGARVVVVESYPGVRADDLQALARALDVDLVVEAAEALKPADVIEDMVERDVTDDPVFGRLSGLTLEDFFEPGKLLDLRARITEATGRVAVLGTGASLIASEGLLVFADVSRWENTLRIRAGEYRNLGSEKPISPRLAYKRAWFVDWRAADRHKRSAFRDSTFTIDTNDPSAPKMVPTASVLRALDAAARRPFRVVPYFDPAPWGGQWMKEVCDLDRSAANYGWCFDCVPEENSLLLDFGSERFEMPSIDLIRLHAKEVLGEKVHGRFGEEFPIRFDFLDTMEGGNLSLQVHPLTEYAHDRFGLPFTQDESYYILDAEPEAHVYLGVRSDVDREAMLADLRRAENGEISFDAERYVNRFAARKHDHFLIPAGTIHCSSRCMVLEISATPYIFTFKLWDWDRPGLDGLPRPVHVDHGENVIRWERDTEYAKERLINRIWETNSGDGWVEEHTGLHEAEFIETRRRWFTTPAPHRGHDGGSVLNLVEGEEAVVTSPDNAFDPFVVHYAETFIVPAAAGAFDVEPFGKGEGTKCGTIEAYVRSEP
jgi:hypothetical protein